MKCLLSGRQEAKEPTLTVVVLQSNMTPVSDEFASLPVFEFHYYFDGP